MGESSSIKIPNSFENVDPSNGRNISKMKNNGRIDRVKFLQDSLIHRMDSPVKNRVDFRERK